jgi:SAM-dependent methyltransferase
MNPALAARLPLICIACRSRSEAGRELYTVGVAQILRQAPDGDVEEGILACGHCGQRYPILDGVAILAREPASLGEVPQAMLSPELEALLAEDGPDDAPFAHLVEHLSIYMDAHWGDRAEPGPDGPGAGFGLSGLEAPLLGRTASPVEAAVELGCSVGRAAQALSRGAGVVAAIDRSFAALRRARRLLRGEAVRYSRRVSGRHYATATVRTTEESRNVVFVCADALDPPLAPGHFQRVVMLNLVDAVRSPLQLLSVADALCARRGEILLSSPYAWSSAIVDERERLGRDSAQELAAKFLSGNGLEAPYSVEEETEIDWRLRRDARSAVVYRAHYLRVRKS